MEESGFTLEEQTLQHAKLSAGGVGARFFLRSVFLICELLMILGAMEALVLSH